MAKIEPLIAMGRSRHHVSWKQRFAAAPKSLPDSATALKKMACRLKTPRGKSSTTAQAEPRTGVRHHQIRDGLSTMPAQRDRKRKGEWNLVTMSWNIKRMFAMQPC